MNSKIKQKDMNSQKTIKNSQTAMRNQQNLDGSSSSFDCVGLDDQKFIKRFITVNSTCFKLIQNGIYKEPLKQLQKAQEQLQASVKCSRKIPTSIITTTLHNLACIHQRQGNYNKALDYVRAILHNLNNHLPWEEKEDDVEQQIQNLGSSMATAKYYLYFLALLLEMRMFQASNIPANRCIQYFKKLCKQYRKYELPLSLINTKMTTSLHSKIQQFQQVFNKTSVSQLLYRLKQSLLNLKQTCIQPSFALSSYKQFNIQKIITIQPIQIIIRQSGQLICSNTSSHKIFQNALIQFSIVLFLISKAQLEKFKNKYKNNESNSDKKQIRNSKTSKNYFLSNNQEKRSLQKAKKYILWSLYFGSQIYPYFTMIHKQMIEYYLQSINQGRKMSKNINSAINQQKDDEQLFQSQSQIIQICRIMMQTVYKSIQNPDAPKNKKQGAVRKKQHQISNHILSQERFDKIIQIEKNKNKMQKLAKLTKNNREIGKSIKTKSMVFGDYHKKSQTQLKLPIQQKMLIQQQKKNNITEHNTKKTRSKSYKSNVSVKSSKSNLSKKEKLKKPKDNQRGAYEEYFKGSQIPKYKVKTEKLIKNSKEPRQIAKNYFGLQNEVIQRSKTLSKKKQKLFQSLKKV